MINKVFPYILGLVFMVFVFSCEKAVNQDENPFVKNYDPPAPTDTVNPYTIQGLHKYLFEPKCANPACHDGTFEPDFRTVQSSYNTLVYHPVVKNDTLGTYNYRVVPNNIGESWLVERLLTGDPVLGRMPLYAPALSAEELQWVYGWINQGAQDMNGNTAIYPNTPPQVRYYLAMDANEVRIDTNRVNGWSSPFIAPASTFSIVFRVFDDSTAANQLLNNTLLLSTNRDDFTNATAHPATFIQNFWIVTLNSATLQTGVQYYMQYQVEDTDNTGVTQYPAPQQPYWFKENASFIIQ